MALYVIRPPNPPAGQDWRNVVPGQYLYNVTGITATLTTARVAPPTLADASGNGNTATTNATRTDITWGVAGPFGGGPPNLALVTGNSQSQREIAVAANAGQFDVATVTFEAIVNPSSLGGGGIQEIITQRRSDGTLPLRWIFGLTTSGTSTLRIANSNVSAFNIGPAFSANAWHHVAVTYDGAQWVPYIDGVAGAAVVGNPPTLAQVLLLLTLGGETYSIQSYIGGLAACAIFNGALTGAQIAAHAAAVAVSSAAYKAAVLADTPIALWMLDELSTLTGRTVALDVTDGARTVASFPAPFATTAVGGPLLYSWAPAFSSSSQTPASAVTSVSIPELILPAGYTVGTRTPDLLAGDQWSNIVIWWDSNLMDNAGGTHPYEYAPGIHLITGPRT